MEESIPNIYGFLPDVSSLRQVSRSLGESVSSYESSIMDTIQGRYPQYRCLYPILVQANADNDLDTIRRIVSYKGYMPINWGRFIYKARDVEILRMIRPLVQDTAEIDLMIKALIISDIKEIESLPAIDSDGIAYFILLYGRMDLIDQLVQTPRYEGILYSEHIYAPKSVLLYLDSVVPDYLDDGDRAILHDTVLPSPPSDNRFVASYDAWNVFLSMESKRSINPIVARGRVREYLLDMYAQEDTLPYIIMGGLGSPIDDNARVQFLYDLYMRTTNTKLKDRILLFSIREGYTEILDCFLNKDNLLRVLALANSHSNTSTSTIMFMNRYRMHPEWFLPYIDTKYMHKTDSMPDSVRLKFIANAMMADSHSLVHKLIKSRYISPNMRERIERFAKQHGYPTSGLL